ncbi:MAG: hypothetical protein JWN24_3535 [Phycisphaerales bacterium]|nr:hypothetical protein [Phycisphaerales bacterium]
MNLAHHTALSWLGFRPSNVMGGDRISAASGRRRSGWHALRAAVCVEPLERRRLLAQIVVNELGDDLTPDGKVNLREAIMAAETDTSVDGSVAGTGNDTITFDPALTAAGDATITLSSFYSGLGTTEFGPSAFIISTNITIIGPSGNNGITIQRDPAATSAYRLFHVQTGASLTLDNLTLSNGLAKGGNGGGGAAGLGGGVFNQGTLILNGDTLTGNTAIGGNGDGNYDSGGGGVGADGAMGSGGADDGGGPNPGLGDLFSDPNGGYGGGGAADWAQSAGGNGGFGGGGGNGFDTGGNGGFGGGGGGGGSSAGVGGFGGGDGIYDVQGIGVLGGGGGGGMGGAIFNESGTVTLTNSTLSGNSAQGGNGAFGANGGSAFGAALFARDGTTTLLNCDLVDNSVTPGNGGFATADGAGFYAFSDDSIGGTASVSINNTVVALSSPGINDFVAQGSGVAVAGSNNLVQSNVGVPAGVISQTADPQLGALADNGGPTFTHLPAPTSPLIDNGSNAAASGLATDQRGRARIAPAGGAIDIGAIEVQPAVAPPTYLGTQIDDGNRQRSLVRSLKFTFSSPVTLAAGAITLARLNTGGSGTNNGAPPTDASITLGTPTTSDGGLSWVIPIKTSSSFSSFGSLTDGIYTATIHASLVTDSFGQILSGGDQVKTFHRLYGDINGDKRISNADFTFFSNAYNASFGQANYNQYFDFTNQNAKIGNADFTQFANRYNKQFVYSG